MPVLETSAPSAPKKGRTATNIQTISLASAKKTPQQTASVPNKKRSACQINGNHTADAGPNKIPRIEQNTIPSPVSPQTAEVAVLPSDSDPGKRTSAETNVSDEGDQITVTSHDETNNDIALTVVKLTGLLQATERARHAAVVEVAAFRERHLRACQEVDELRTKLVFAEGRLEEQSAVIKMKDKQLVNLQTQLEGFRTNQRDKDGEKAAWTSTVQSLEADKARLESENEMLSQQLHQLTSEGVQCLAELEDTRTDLAKAMERISHMMEVQGTSISSVPATADQEAQTSSEVPAESSTPKPSLSPRTRGDDFQASRPQSEPVPQIPSAHQDLSKANRSDKEAQRFSEPPAQTSASQPFLQLTASGSEGSPSKKADETPVETQPQSLAERSNFEESRCPQRLQQDQNLKWDFSRLQIPRSEDIAPAADGSGHQVVPTDNTTQGGESTPHEALAGMFQFQFKGTQGSSPEARVRSSRVGSRTKAGSLTRNAGTPTPTPTTGKISAPDMRKTRQATKALAPAKKKPVRRSVRFSDSPCPSSKAESLVVEDDGPILDEIVVAP